MEPPILDVADLAVWARQEIAPDDAYANLIVNAVSVLINARAGRSGSDTWTKANAPARIKDIAGVIARRNWLNPTQVTHEGSIGPIGGDTYIKDFAAGLSLTEAEEQEILRLAGLQEESSGAGILGTMSFHTGQGRRDEVIYLPDTGGSDWMIPFVDTSQDTFYRPVD